jgi:hypothetical protein
MITKTFNVTLNVLVAFAAVMFAIVVAVVALHVAFIGGLIVYSLMHS